MQCSACGGDNAAEAKFCRHCGASLAPASESGLTCSACGASNSQGARFCKHCGAALSVTPLTTEASTDHTPLLARAFGAAEPPRGIDATQPIAPPPAPTVEKAPPATDTSTGVTPAANPAVVWGAGLIALAAIAATLYILFFRSAPMSEPSTAQAPASPTAAPAPTPAQPAAPEPAAAAVTPTTPATAARPEAPKPAPAPAPKPSAAAAPKPALAPAQSTTETPAAPASPPAPAPSPPARSAFERELDACRSKGFFERGICTEQVKWKYCTVDGVWDTSKPGCER